MSSASDFQRLQNVIEMNLTRINNNTTDLERLVNSIGTPDDSSPLRERYHRLQNETKQLVQQTNDALSQLKNITTYSDADQRRKKSLVEELPKKYVAAINRLQSVQRNGVQRERQSLDRARGVSIHNGGISDSPFSGDNPAVGYQTQQVVLPMEQDVDMERLRQRDQELRELEKNIVEVNELFKDVAQLVHEQGGIIDSIEQHVVVADNNVYTGNKQLVQARHYQTSARRKKIILVVICIVILIVIALILYFVLKK